MYYFVSLSVGVILFEGGLTLKFKEVRKIAGVVRNLLIIGSLIMLIGGALAAYYILEMDYRVGLLFGSNHSDRSDSYCAYFTKCSTQ